MSWIIEGGGLFEVGANRATMLDRDADRRIGPLGAETATGRGLWKNFRDALESDPKRVNVSLVRAACSVFREHPTPGSSRNWGFVFPKFELGENRFSGSCVMRVAGVHIPIVPQTLCDEIIDTRCSGEAKKGFKDRVPQPASPWCRSWCR